MSTVSALADRFLDPCILANIARSHCGTKNPSAVLGI